MSQDTDSTQQAAEVQGTEHSTRGAYVTGGAEFNRDTNYIEDRITRDASPGTNGEPG
jgi:glutathionyl-hydroquinone reductase